MCLPSLTVRSFKVHYGAPVAYILAQHQKQAVSFHLNPPTVSATGEPDFIFYLNGVTELMAGEGKVGCWHCAAC